MAAGGEAGAQVFTTIYPPLGWWIQEVCFAASWVSLPPEPVLVLYSIFFRFCPHFTSHGFCFQPALQRQLLFFSLKFGLNVRAASARTSPLVSCTLSRWNVP